MRLGNVDAAVKRLVVDHLEPIDGARLDGLYRIGMDEISYKRGHQYLTVVADHDSGRVVWVGREHSQEVVHEFLDALGPDPRAAVEAVTLDGSSIFRGPLVDRLPNARVCLDPFHVMKWVNKAMDKVYAAQPARPAVWNGQRKLGIVAGFKRGQHRYWPGVDNETHPRTCGQQHHRAGDGPPTNQCGSVRPVSVSSRTARRLSEQR